MAVIGLTSPTMTTTDFGLKTGGSTPPVVKTEGQLWPRPKQ